MPKVGNKHFSYTKKGKKEAKKYAEKTKKKIKMRGGGLAKKGLYARGPMG
tara:strand:- start:1749 stop:1898 length:150 start_codon:yes stop_codon:yes gene_type:complete